MALTQTHWRFTWPEGSLTRMRCTLGLKVRLVCLTSWSPMPPLFLDWPLCMMRRPLTGRFPVTEQMRDMVSSG